MKVKKFPWIFSVLFYLVLERKIRWHSYALCLFHFVLFVMWGFIYLACALLQNNSPISWKLGEEVVTKCAAKLASSLREAAKSMHISLADYSPIVASICQIESGDLKHNCGSDSGGNLVGVTLYKWNSVNLFSILNWWCSLTFLDLHK